MCAVMYDLRKEKKPINMFKVNPNQVKVKVKVKVFIFLYQYTRDYIDVFTIHVTNKFNR